MRPRGLRFPPTVFPFALYEASPDRLRWPGWAPSATGALPSQRSERCGSAPDRPLSTPRLLAGSRSQGGSIYRRARQFRCGAPVLRDDLKPTRSKRDSDRSRANRNWRERASQGLENEGARSPNPGADEGRPGVLRAEDAPCSVGSDSDGTRTRRPTSCRSACVVPHSGLT